jgi:D-amino peptidase
MVSGAERQIDAAIFIGYHARAGTKDAILAHTWSKSTVFNLWLNGRLCGEIGLNASLCGHFDVPVIFLSGDQAACAEAVEWMGPQIKTASVKRAGGFQASECLPSSAALELIMSGAQEAVSTFLSGRGPAPLRTSGQITVGVELMQPCMADLAVFIPGVTRIDGRKVEYTSPDIPSAQHTFRAVVEMAYSTL